jgi:hypothetical protein
VIFKKKIKQSFFSLTSRTGQSQAARTDLRPTYWYCNMPGVAVKLRQRFLITQANHAAWLEPGQPSQIKKRKPSQRRLVKCFSTGRGLISNAETTNNKNNLVSDGLTIPGGLWKLVPRQVQCIIVSRRRSNVLWRF